MTSPRASSPDVRPGLAPLRWVGLLVLLGALVALPFFLSDYRTFQFTQAIVYAIVLLGLNLLTGYNGQISLGHGAFFGLGAFVSGILVTEHGWYVEATIPVGALAAALLGVLVGFPALRVKGLYLALLTLGLSVLFPRLIAKVVHGDGGVPLLQPSRSQVASLINGLADDQYQYFVCLAIMVVLFLMAWSLINSRAGRAMISVRDHEVAAETVGINVSAVKVTTFALSAAYAGVAGSLAGSSLAKAMDGRHLLLAFAAIMAAIALSMLRTPKSEGDPGVHITPKLIARLAPLGVATGFVAGFFGIGGGFLIVPGLMLATDMTMSNAAASSLVSVALFGLTTSINYAASNLVDWRMVSLLLAGGMIGGGAGLFVVEKWGARGLLLRRAFAFAVILVAAFVASKAIAQL